VGARDEATRGEVTPDGVPSPRLIGAGLSQAAKLEHARALNVPSRLLWSC
jgi:hypothetical protein